MIGCCVVGSMDLGCWTVTSAMRGAFVEDARTRKEFMGLIQSRSQFN